MTEPPALTAAGLPAPVRALYWDDATIARFWAYQANCPEHAFSRQFGQGMTATIMRLCRPSGRVLDYGAGLGFLIPPLVAKGYTVTAFEVSPALTQQLKKLHEGLRGFAGVATASDLPHMADYFDIVVMAEVIEHLSDTQLDAAFSTLRRVLRPGGVLFITTPNDEDLSSNTVFCPRCNHTFHRWQHVRSFNPTALDALVRQHGFAPQVTRPIDFGLGRDGRLHAVVSRCRYALGIRREPHLYCLARRTA